MMLPRGSQPAYHEQEWNWEDTERVSKEIRPEVTRLLDAMSHFESGYLEPDEDKWRDAATCAAFNHPDVLEIHTGEAEWDRLVQDALDDW